MWLLLFGVVAVGCSKSSVTLTADEQLVYDVNLIDQYIADNSISNAIKLESGLRYSVTQMGTGATATKDNCVTFTYAVYIMPNAEALQTNTTGYKAPLKSQILGMQLALKLLPVGSKATVLIPSGLAYGTGGAKDVPRNSNLRYDLEVLALSNYNALGNYCYE
jgi:FKBP-type peptidyl-prolyl cis-trans isomerase